MPNVDLLLVGQGAFKRMDAVGAGVTVSYSTRPGDAAATAAGITFAANVLTVPFVPALFRFTNDGAANILVQCAGGDPGVTVTAGSIDLLICDGRQVKRVGNLPDNDRVTANIAPFAGGGQGSATALNYGHNFVNDPASNMDSVKLPPAVAGAVAIVYVRSGSNTLAVWPNGSDTINGVPNDPIDYAYSSMSAGSAVIPIAFGCGSDGAWICSTNNLD